MMAYGISGAGKTYTIEGPRSDPGILPQALAQVFEVEHVYLPNLVCSHWALKQSDHLPPSMIAVTTGRTFELVKAVAGFSGA
jgi:hypothetical protein